MKILKILTTTIILFSGSLLATSALAATCPLTYKGYKFIQANLISFHPSRAFVTCKYEENLSFEPSGIHERGLGLWEKFDPYLFICGPKTGGTAKTCEFKIIGK